MKKILIFLSVGACSTAPTKSLRIKGPSLPVAAVNPCQAETPSQPPAAACPPAPCGYPPGVYSAAPWSMTVVVPEPVDPGMTVGLAHPVAPAMPGMEPEIRLYQKQ